MLEEKFDNGDALKVEVDCLKREENVAIVGGVVKDAPGRHPAGKAGGRRAYVKVVDDGKDKVKGDFVSNVYFDDGIDSHCSTAGLAKKFVVEKKKNVKDPRVSVCSKHGDWEGCLEKAKVELAVE